MLALKNGCLSDHGVECAYFVFNTLSSALTYKPSQITLPPSFMLKIGKLAQQAIAAASYLAECYDEETVRVSAAEIADARGLPRPLVSKVLAHLSQQGITTGTTGPTGGYRLAKAPEDISLQDIVAVFERLDIRPMCPFGPNWCGVGERCPMHDAITQAGEQVDAFLSRQHLGPFRKHGAKTTKKTTTRKPR